MDDSISRAAAIEEIARRDATDGTVKVYSGREINTILGDLPALDAIPIDWLREKMNSAYEPDSKAAWRVLKMWKGEHDVHD